jgi:PAS domain S-box-containing protein
MQERQARRNGSARMGLANAAQGSTEGSSMSPVTERRYRAVFDSVRDAILLVDGTGRYIDANPAATELLGYHRRELLSMRVVDLVAAQPEWTESEFRQFREQESWTGEIELRCKDGSVARVEASAIRIHGEPGPVYVSVLRDLAERTRVQEERAELLRSEQEARAQAEAALQQVRLVSDVSQLLAVSPDYPATFHRLAETMVREIADLCLIDMVDEAGVISRVAAVHASQSKQSLADRLAEEWPPRPGGSDPIAKTLSTGSPHSSPMIHDRLLREKVQDDEHLWILRELGIHSLLSVPLIARGRTIGCLTLISTTPDIRYEGRDVRLAEEIARRAAVRIDNARLYEERDHTAKVLQRSLLPRDLPDIPHVDLAARYLPVGEGNEVGGDFYDVFDCADGSWAAVVGDVCGKGPEAAAVTGLVRHTLRALARFQRRPSTLLEELNRSLLEQSVDERFCTVCYLRLRPTPDHVRVTLCSAGHPLPVMLRRDGRLMSAGRPGQLLGVFPDVSLADSVIDLGVGDAIVIYTDGAIEQRGAELVAGEKTLRDAVAASLGHDAAVTAAKIEEAIRSARGSSPPSDDVALLVIRAAEGPS